MPIAPWTIVRVDFPFADTAATRRRPALVIANPEATAEFSLLWLLMITTAPQGLWPFDVPITDLPRGGLTRPCVVRTTKITSLDSRLATPIGDLAPADRTAIAAHFKTLFAPAVATH